MALENEITRVAGGTKDTLKTLITKLGGTVGDERIDQYSDLAGKVTKPDKWDKGVLLDGGALKDVNGKDIHADVKAALDIPAANDAKLTIQENGAEVGTFSANASADKTVNITVPTKASDIGAATATDLQSTQSAVDTLSDKVGTVPTGKTVVKMIEDAQAAATYNDAPIKADIKKNTDAIAVLNGSGVGSVDKKITDAFNDFATKVSDDGVVNSYKELIDWAATHGAEAATMAGEITTLKNILKGIGGTGESATVVAYVTSAIAALKIGDYAKAADLTALAKRVTAAEGKITTLTGDEKTAGSVKKALADAKSYTDAQIKAIPTPDVSGQINAHNTDATAHADIREAVSKAGKPFIIEGTMADASSDGFYQITGVSKSRAETKAAVQAGGLVMLRLNAAIDLPLTQFSFDDGTDTYIFSAMMDGAYRVSLYYTGTQYDAVLFTASIPPLSDDAPSAPGTASAGTSSNAARADHVHPKEVSDTDRANWDGKASKPKACLVTLKASGWDAADKTQVATVACVVADEAAQMIYPMPKIGQITDYNDAGIQLIAQGDGNVTFMCDTIPEADVDVWVVTEDVEDVTPPPSPFLTFSSPGTFTLKTANATKNWDGVLEYSTDKSTWLTWNGTTELTSSSDNRLYLRGTGNTKITGDSGATYAWALTGSNVSCDGNIENLLDWKTVEQGKHPTMNEWCYASMFQGCTSLTTAPALPATTLARACYASMFQGCTSLTTAPALPATTLDHHCYQYMFDGCTSLTTAPALPAITLGLYCCQYMFCDCTSLTTVPALLATTLTLGCYDYMFLRCTKIKISATASETYTNGYRIPLTGNGTTSADALKDMFAGTGGTFAGTPEINTEYYLDASNTIIYTHSLLA